MDFKTIVAAVGAAAATVCAGAGIIFLVPLIMPAIGALCGLVVGFVFDDTSRAFLDALGMQALSMWQFGAMAAFTGSFFRTKVFK